MNWLDRRRAPAGSPLRERPVRRSLRPSRVGRDGDTDPIGGGACRGHHRTVVDVEHVGIDGDRRKPARPVPKRRASVSSRRGEFAKDYGRAFLAA
jgi:hypothetical protein